MMHCSLLEREELWGLGKNCEKIESGECLMHYMVYDYM